MEENIKIKNGKISFLLKTIICFTLLLVIFLLAQKNLNNNFAVLANSDFEYLSDIKCKSSKVGDKTLLLDKNMSGKLITVSINGVDKFFLKGILAHAASEVIYDLNNYNYDYFTAYIGVDIASREVNQGDGVKFKIYTSQDEENWTEILNDNSTYKANTDSRFVKLDIKGAKYLKLVAEAGRNNWSDHSVYANAKLVKEGYIEKEDEPVDFIKTVEEYDAIIKEHYGEKITGEYEHALLKRELVKRVGYDILQAFAQMSNENEEMLSWLMNNPENLNLYILGGTPDGGNYYSSLNVLSKLYHTYNSDFSITEKTKYGTVLGDLYKKMAITLSLTHSQTVALWMQPGNPGNQSDAVTRYQIYKDMHKNGKFVVTSTIDITKWFEGYSVEEMRFVLNNIIDDEEILWLNEYTQSYIDKQPNKAWTYLTPHPYMAYVWPNYGNPVFHDPERKDYWDEKFNGIFSKYGVTYSTENNKIYKVWMNFRNEFGTGAVCGGISKTGSNIRTSHGIPAAVIGQPGHAAIIYYTQDEQGRGYWNIDNDVSGWTLSEKGERMLLGWGNSSYSRGSYQVVYMTLAQEALNDYESFEKCEKLVMLADVYKEDFKKQEEIYRDAIKAQHINIDAWYGLINLYKANESKTEEDFYQLAQELTENLKYFPLPMYQLSNLIKTELTSIENSYKFTLLQTRILTEATKVPNNSADNYYVYQPGITRTEANFLLGKLDKTIATFSFDGDNARKIVLSNRFDGNGIRWDYSLDGKKTWKEVSFTAEEEHKLTLSEEEINSITAENDIYVHIVGVDYEEENLYKIDIQESPGIPETLYANDAENKFIGAPANLQWKFNENDGWTLYGEKEPDLTGNKTIIVKMGATGVYLPSIDTETYEFTEENEPDTRKYIPISHLSIHEVSTQAINNAGAATNAIDGNYNTRWHSAWNGTDTDRFITIKLDQPVNLSAVEFIPAGGGNGKMLDGTIYGSMDGENWEELASMKNITYTNQANSVKDAIANMKKFEIEEAKQVQYVKIVADRASNGNWFTARAFNLYQNITKITKPTADIAYSTTEETNAPVEAKLINPSTEITITNNDGKDTYIFNENGEFTFEFCDKDGNVGSATAKVNWIVKQTDIPEEKANITSKNYTIEQEYISKVLPGTKVEQFKKNVEANREIVITSEDGKVLAEDSILATGMIVKVGPDLQYTIVVTGDIDRDGRITTNDIANIKLHFIGKKVLTGIGLKAADLDGDNRITINDVAKAKLIFIGATKIK